MELPHPRSCPGLVPSCSLTALLRARCGSGQAPAGALRPKTLDRPIPTTAHPSTQGQRPDTWAGGKEGRDLPKVTRPVRRELPSDPPTRGPETKPTPPTPAGGLKGIKAWTLASGCGAQAARKAPSDSGRPPSKRRGCQGSARPQPPPARVQGPEPRAASLVGGPAPKGRVGGWWT